MNAVMRWAPAFIMGLGAVGTVGVDAQRTMPLQSPLGTAVPLEIEEYRGENVTVSGEELQAVGVSEYLMRNYAGTSKAGDWFSVYIGYYDRQTQGKTIHSPKNCLPGAGWEALASREATIETDAGVVTVNRYVLQREDEQALVLYWYQGRGRVQANEYLVKRDLLLDAMFRQRTEEALARIVVPITDDESRAFDLAAEVARELVPALERALPT